MSLETRLPEEDVRRARGGDLRQCFPHTLVRWTTTEGERKQPFQSKLDKYQQTFIPKK